MSREVPKGWRVTTLDDVCSHVARGDSPKYADNNTGVWALGQRCIRNEGIDWDYLRPHSMEKRIKEPSILQPGDVCINSTGTGTLGRVGFWTGSQNGVVFADTHVTVLRAEVREVWPRFLFEWLRSDHTHERIYMQCVTGSTNQIELSRSSLKSLSLLLPPLHEQRRIAEILSSVDETIAATRAVIEQTRKVKQGVLGRLLTKGIGHTRFKQTAIGKIPEGWEVATIEAYLTRLIDYRGVPPPKSDSGVPLITAKNVRFGYLNPEPREYISEDDFDGWMRRGLPEAGDVLFTTEAPLGNVAQIPDYKIALGQRTITLCPDKARLTPTFLKWLLLSPGSQARIAENATGSTALGIKQSTFRKLKFPFPPLDEQKSIADHIEGIAAAEGAGTSRLESLKMLKAALMSDLLTGRKRVTDALPMAAE